MADWLCDYCGYNVGGKNGVPGNTARIYRHAVTHQTFEQCHSLMNTYGDKKAMKPELEPVCGSGLDLGAITVRCINTPGHEDEDKPHTARNLANEAVKTSFVMHWWSNPRSTPIKDAQEKNRG